MIHLLLGQDKQAKDRKIQEIKASCLLSNEAFKFDYESLDGDKLDPAELKKALLALPAIAQKRLILLRDVDKINAHNKEIILDFARSGSDHAVLLLDIDGTSGKGSFLRDLMPLADVTRFEKKEVKKDIWNVTKAMERRNGDEALKLLNTLFEEGDSPVKILGALVWFWGSFRNRLSRNGFKKGLLVLQEADLNIKRSRVRPEYAVEIAVTKLSLLIAC